MSKDLVLSVVKRASVANSMDRDELEYISDKQLNTLQEKVDDEDEFFDCMDMVWHPEDKKI